MNRVDSSKWRHLLGTLPDKTIARKYNETSMSVGRERRRLKIPAYERTRAERRKTAAAAIKTAKPLTDRQIAARVEELRRAGRPEMPALSSSAGWAMEG
jgi:hypothetical protein